MLNLFLWFLRLRNNSVSRGKILSLLLKKYVFHSADRRASPNKVFFFFLIKELQNQIIPLAWTNSTWGSGNFYILDLNDDKERFLDKKSPSVERTMGVASCTLSSVYRLQKNLKLYPCLQTFYRWSFGRGKRERLVPSTVNSKLWVFKKHVRMEPPPRSHVLTCI